MGIQTTGAGPSDSLSESGSSLEGASSQFTDRSTAARESVSEPGVHFACVLADANEQLDTRLKLIGEILYDGRQT